MRLWQGSLFCLATVLLSGCGGGGSSSAKIASPSVTVDWPMRGRDVQGPSSALSCQFTLQPVGFTASNIVISGNRPTAPAAASSTYKASRSAKAGLWNLTGNFYPVAGEFGTPVGTVSQQVRIQKDGSMTLPDNTPLNLTFTGVIASAQIESGQLVTVGGQTPLSATAYDANSDVVVVSPGSFVFAPSGTSSNLTVAASGFVTGVSIGSGLATATIDGVSAPPQSVTVTPAFRSFAIAGNDMSYSPSTDTLWVAIEFGETYLQGAVVPVNATTGAMGTAMAVNDFPIYVAATNDGQYVYTIGALNTLYRINLASGQVDESVALPIGDSPVQLLAVPGTPNSVAVVTVSASDGVSDEGTIIYDGITPRQNVATIGQSVTFNAAGTRAYGYQQNQTAGNLYATANVDGTGITGANSQVTSIQGFTNQIQWANGKMLANDGTVIDPDSGSLLGNLPSALASLPAPVPLTNFVYFVTPSPAQIQEFDLSTLISPFSSPLEITGDSVIRAIALPSNRVAVMTASEFGNTINVIRGLPN